MAHSRPEILGTDIAGIDRAVAIWCNGGLVAFPTETVYGLGADACNGPAVAAIYQAKGRPGFNPLIIHVADLETAERFAVFDDLARRLAAAFWPGPLSLILPIAPGSGLSPLVTAGLKTVAVRIPANPLARRLLKRFGGAVAAPSANPSGRISATTAVHVIDGLGGRIDAVIDGGACDIGLESTILFPANNPPALLRPGGLAAEEIERFLHHPLARRDDPLHPLSPGQLATHYAPGTTLKMNVKSPPEGALWLGFGPDCRGATLNLSPKGDLIEAAANLFACLHQLDQQAQTEGKPLIAVAPIPAAGLGVAINDRLKRAAASG